MASIRSQVDLRPRGQDIAAVLEAALASVDPRQATAQRVRVDDGELLVSGKSMGYPDSVLILAFGKAAGPMAFGVVDSLGAVHFGGIVVSSHEVPVPRGMKLMVGGHPVPTKASRVAAQALLEASSQAPRGSVILYLVSGGGSALVEAPAPQVGLSDLQVVTDHLLRCGAPIDAINIVRRQLSAVKGGRLGAAASVPFGTLALSDVVGSPPEAIASGPTVASPTTAADARRVLSEYAFPYATAPSLDDALAENRPAFEVAEGPYVVVGDGATAGSAAVAYARDQGWPARVLATDLKGEARQAAVQVIEDSPDGEMGVVVGETTVTVTGKGIGGRNQEAALAAAVILDGTNLRFATLATDGVDGPTTAAGALVDGSTAARARRLGIDLTIALGDNNSHEALKALDALLITGPTGTNVGDIWIVDMRNG